MIATSCGRSAGTICSTRFQTALVKRPDARLLVISTAASSLDTPLGRLRTRALAAPSVTRSGVITEAVAADIRALEWSVTPDEVGDDAKVVQANPASWIDADAIRRQRESVPGPIFEQVPLLRLRRRTRRVAPARRVAGMPGRLLRPGRHALLGSASTSAGRARPPRSSVVTDDYRVPVVRVFQGDDAVLEATEAVRDIARRYRRRGGRLRPVAVPVRSASHLEAEGVTCVEFPQSHSRMVRASENLHRLVAERTLKHPGDPALDAHVAAVAKQTGRGWRLDKSARTVQIDAVVALAMAAERAGVKPEPVRLLGFV
jgi:hypothetical protein